MAPAAAAAINFALDRFSDKIILTMSLVHPRAKAEAQNAFAALQGPPRPAAAVPDRVHPARSGADSEGVIVNARMRLS